MNNISKEDFLQLIQEANRDLYETDDEELRLRRMESESISAEAEERKARMYRAKNINQVIDVTNMKSQSIFEAIKKTSNIKVGKFSIKLISPGNDSAIGIDIFEFVEKQGPYGTSRIDTKVDVLRDNRFQDVDWLEYFKPQKRQTPIPFDTVLDIVRWCQALTKIIAFL